MIPANALSAATAAIQAAAALARERLRSPKAITYKGRRDLVTEVDLAIEDLLRTRLGAAFPDFGFLGEEGGGAMPLSGYTWVIDPIDGTTNYAQGLGLFAISVGLVHDGEPVLGLIADPARDELFIAQRGRGVTCNGRPVRVSAVTTLEEAIIGCDLGYDEQLRQASLQTALQLLPRALTIRIIGSAVLALAQVAAGRFGLFFHNALWPWDLAAGLLLVREAGGVVETPAGVPAGLYDRAVIAGNPALIAAYRAAVAKLASPGGFVPS